MTTSYYADRANVSRLSHLHPDWTQPQLAQATGRSVGWVKKWLKRFREEEAQGLALYEILQGHSRARKHPPASTPPQVVERILALRDQPPEGLRRIPGRHPPFSITCRVTPNCEPVSCPCRAPVAPFIACSKPPDASPPAVHACTSLWSVPRP